jgi:uncharacterized protein YndB with AHSA1/START domain
MTEAANGEADGAIAVERSLQFPAGAAEVWDALCDPALLADWFGGDVVLDLRPGGALVVGGPDGSERRAAIDDVSPPDRLAFTWEGDDQRPASTVAIELEPNAGGCTVRVRETLVEVEGEGEVEGLLPRAHADERVAIGFQPPARPADGSGTRRGEALALARS